MVIWGVVLVRNCSLIRLWPSVCRQPASRLPAKSLSRPSPGKGPSTCLSDRRSAGGLFPSPTRRSDLPRSNASQWLRPWRAIFLSWTPVASRSDRRPACVRALGAFSSFFGGEKIIRRCDRDLSGERLSGFLRRCQR